MSSICFSARTFSGLIQRQGFKPKERIRKLEQYFAHTPPSGKDREKESLVSHMEKVKTIFLELVDLHGLDGIVDRHINVLALHNEIKEKQKFYEFLKLLFFEAIHFHDLGKLNENYQIEKMGSVGKFKKQDNSIGSTHSNLSTFLFYAYMFEKLEIFETDTEKGFAFIFILLFTMPIRKHHAPDMTNPFYYFEKSFEVEKNHFFETVDIQKIIKYLGKMNIEFNQRYHNDIFWGLNLDEHYKKPFFTIFLQKINSFPLWSLIKLNSSLLTISDYIATSQYMWDVQLKLQGVVHQRLREQVYKGFYSTKEYNEILNSRIPKEIDDLKHRSEDNLNELRFRLAVDIRKALLENADKNLFFLEAPTGGGKTNLSFMAVAELLKTRLELNKVFYVFPFTTLATQTRESLSDTLNLEPEYFTELHSKAGFKENENIDGAYGNKKINFIDYQFVNYPFTLLTHIRFFDMIKSHKKKDNYLYHKLANSIVIIDELQAYSPEHWDKIYYFLKNISELFNTVFIVMSATLPKIDGLKISEDRLDFSQFIHLNRGKSKYFENANFKNRVEFDLTLITRDRKNSMDEIKEKLFEESEEYSKKNNGRCWTLIEFIFKNEASKFYERIEEEASLKEYEVKMLSGTILEPVRKNIIHDLKKRTKNNEKSKIILISTQVIEAGVDLDFDLGFKDTSILDSDEQLAGRINRNASKTGCKVFLFNYNDEYHIYGSDYRYRIQKQEFDREKYEAILKNKDFDGFYKSTFKFMNELNKSESRYNFFDYESLVRKLSYPAVHNEFKLIDQETLSIFVNVKYDLKRYHIENTLGLEKNGKLCGKDVFDKYCAIVENRDQDFIDRQIYLTEIQGLMSNFIFSTYKSKNMIDKLFIFTGGAKYGFWYIPDLINSSQREIYTLEGGLNEKELGDVQFI